MYNVYFPLEYERKHFVMTLKAKKKKADLGSDLFLFKFHNLSKIPV